MGKAEEQRQPLPSGVSSEDPQQNAEAQCGCRCSGVRKFVGTRCILVLLLSFAVFLSAMFWLPPFLRLADQKDLLADSKYKDHDIVASFIVNKSVSLLDDNILQLTDEIFDEIGAPSTKVVVLSLDAIPWSNNTKVVFAVDPDGEDSEMSSAAISLIRSSFKSLVINQSILRLTSSLFGVPSFFEVLKFKGGITIIPQQNAFPLQTVQTLFSFTLNFSIYEIQLHFDELTSQLKSGLHLTPFENLYVILSNSEGSTVAAPTIVQSSVLLAIGITPSKERLKQLAQTIMGPHSRNLGLNNTQFGRVKQVRLSSILQHSLHGSGGRGSGWSPSPAPLPRPTHHHHHHHHHRHHYHHHDSHLTPATSPRAAPAAGEGATPPIPAPATAKGATPPVPAPATGKGVTPPVAVPAPATGKGATPPKVGSPAAEKNVPAPGRSPQTQPPDCRFGYRKRSTHNDGKHAHLTPAVAPNIDPRYRVPVASPKPQVEPPAHFFHSVPPLSPLPNVAFAHAEPPPKNDPAAERSNTRFHGPSSSSSSAGSLGAVKWAPLMFIVLVLHV